MRQNIKTPITFISKIRRLLFVVVCLVDMDYGVWGICIAEMEQVLQTLMEIENGTPSNNLTTLADLTSLNLSLSYVPLILQDFCSDFSNATYDHDLSTL